MAAIYLSPKDRLAFFIDLGTMLRAGIPIMEAVEALQEDAKGEIKKALKKMHAALVNGQPLSEVMRQMPQAFDPVTVNLLQAAEESGALEIALQDLAVSTQKEIDFSDEIRASMIYPIFVMALFSGIVVLMLTFVIPRIAKVFVGLRVKIPPVTELMINTSGYFNQNWRLVVAVAFVLLAAGAVIVKVKKRAIIRALLALPGLKTLGRNIDFARFTRSLGLLLKAGVPVNEALTLSQRVVQKHEIDKLIVDMRKQVDLGKPISVSLRSARHGIVPPMMVRATETAESAGTLETTMHDLSEYFERQVTRSLKTITALTEPILLVVVGVMVGALMITIIAPIYNMISQISPN